MYQMFQVENATISLELIKIFVENLLLQGINLVRGLTVLVAKSIAVVHYYYIHSQK